MSVDPILELADLAVSYGAGRHRHTVLSGVSLTVAAGESVGVIGETGSGKSTLARAAVGLVPVRTGTVRIAGEDTTRFTARQWRELRRRGTAQYVFQDPLRALDPEETISDSIAEPLVLQRRLSREQIADETASRLAQVRLDPALGVRLPAELSGGQRQRVLLARALATEPSLLLLDEPVSALDAVSRVAVLAILNDLRRTGTSLVFISHDLGSVAGVTDRIAVLYRGRIVEQGPTAEVIRHPAHPYTRLLIGSAPSLDRPALSRDERRALRAELVA